MRTSLASLALVAGLSAQPNPHVTTMPRVVAGTYANQSNAFPLGRTGGLIQYWYRGDSLPAVPIVTAIGVRPASGAAGPARSQSFEIVFSNTAVGWAAISKTFLNNFGTLTTTAFTRKTVNLPAITPINPDTPVLWMMNDVPVVVIGPNLIVQFDMGPAASAQLVGYTADSFDMAGVTTRHLSSDPSCGGTLAASTTTSPATAFTLTLAGGPPSVAAWFILSANATSSGGAALPFKLDVVNMTGCILGVDPQITVAASTGPSGTASITVPFALPADAYVVYAQAAHQSTANPVGIATTNVTRSVLGAAGYCNYLYNWTIDGPLAQYGPYAYNLSVSLLLKP
jgi:hypothetical protein